LKVEALTQAAKRNVNRATFEFLSANIRRLTSSGI